MNRTPVYIHSQSDTTFVLHSEIRMFFRNMSLPEILTDDVLEFLGVRIIEASSQRIRP